MIPKNMSAILRSLAAALGNALRAKPSTPASPLQTLALPPPGAITASGLTALVAFVRPFVHIVEGKGALTDDVEAANAVMDVIAALDPASAPVIAMIEASEPVFATLVSLAKSADMNVTGGYSDIVGMENDRNFKNR